LPVWPNGPSDLDELALSVWGVDLAELDELEISLLLLGFIRRKKYEAQITLSVVAETFSKGKKRNKAGSLFKSRAKRVTPEAFLAIAQSKSIKDEWLQ